MVANLYETDFYAWTLEQSQLLKDGDLQNLDIINLVEEIESLGKQQRQELRNRLGILIGHILRGCLKREVPKRKRRIKLKNKLILQQNLCHYHLSTGQKK